MRTRGHGLFKETWYSFCSRHLEYDESCHICNSGRWVNNIRHSLSSFIYDHFPRLWIWWVNN